MKKWFCAFVLSLMTAPAFAGGYAGVGYAFSSLQPDDETEDADVGALQFNFGTWLNRESTFGGELRMALGTSDDEVGGNGPQVEIDRYYGAYLRGQFPGNLPIRPYGLVGATRVETTQETARDTSSEDYNDISLGIGADMDLSQQVFVSLEYLRAVDRSGAEISNLTLSVGGRF